MAIKRTYKIIAVDFDGTLCEACYPDIGKANINLIEYLNTVCFLRYCLLTVSHFLLHRFLCSVIERICLLC